MQLGKNTPKRKSLIPNAYGHIVCCNSNLTSLEENEFIQYVNGHFNCSDNQLTTLKGAPQFVHGNFDCSRNQLTSLEDAPKRISEDFYCVLNKLTSLNGIPESIGGSFYCDNSITLMEMARVDLGSKVKGKIYRCNKLEYERETIDKTKCTRAFYDAIIHTSAEEQEDITNI